MTDTPDNKPPTDDANKSGSIRDDFRAAMNEAAGNKWHYWHTLNIESRAGKWDKVAEMFAANPDVEVPYQQFTAEMFHRAANQGRLDIVKTMYARGFGLPEEEGAETLKRLVVFYADKALDVVTYLAQEGKADISDAIYATAARGSTKTMNAFRNAGCDVLAGNSSFFLAFYAGNADMMRYLGAQGAKIYEAPIIAGLYGRSNEVDAAKAEEVKLAYKWLLEEDRHGYSTYYAYVAPHAPDMEQLRGIPPGVADEKQTLLSLAVRGGYFEDILAAAQKKGAPPLLAEDFLRKDIHGISPLAMLAARQELPKLFDVRLWHGKPEEAVKLQAALKDFRAEAAIDIAQFTADLRLHHLKAIAPKARDRLSLKPRKGA